MNIPEASTGVGGFIVGFFVSILLFIIIAGLGTPTYTIESTALENGIAYTVYSTTPFRHDPVFRTMAAEQAWGIWYGLSNNLQAFEEREGTPAPPSKSNGQRYDPDNPGLTDRTPPKVFR